MNPETYLLQTVRLELAKMPGVILWRNAIGHDGRAHVDYGIQNPGGADLIGFVVRDGAAIFIAIEIKTVTGVVSQEQKNFIALVRRHGGIAGVARSVSDAKDIINGINHD